MLIYAVLNLCGVEIQPNSSCLQKRSGDYRTICKVDAEGHRPCQASGPSTRGSWGLGVRRLYGTALLWYLFIFKFTLTWLTSVAKGGVLCPLRQPLVADEHSWMTCAHRPWKTQTDPSLGSSESPVNQPNPHAVSADSNFKACSRVFCE